jgi:NAD(P)-dependent dehydrogenase (short-subunit alcohol dehydrogenase family)
LITGATSGIGREMALQLAKSGVRLILVGRNRSKCESLVNQLGELQDGIEVIYLLADLTSQSDIRALIFRFNELEDRLDLLINNAGALFGQRMYSVDGIEMTFALNHLAHFQLTLGLLHPLRRSPQARVINVSSFAHRFAWLRLHDLESRRFYIGWWVYAHAKLANLLFSYELSCRLADSKITVNAFDPGLIASDFGRAGGGIVSLTKPVLDLISSSVQAGADTGFYLASSLEVSQTTGGYFRHRKQSSSSRRSQNRSQAKELWEISEALIGD